MYIFFRPALYLMFSAVDVASQGIVGVVAYLPPILSLPIFPFLSATFLPPCSSFSSCALYTVCSLFYLLLT